MTYGQERMRLSFNPGSNATVDLIKLKTAELIDLSMTLNRDATSALEAARRYEDAAMWAVKAATAEQMAV